MPFFYKPVDKRSRAKMLRFLREHHRYCGSFAHPVKIRQLGLPAGLVDIALAVAAEEQPTCFWPSVGRMIDAWVSHRPEWRVEFQGRSGGHLALADTCDLRDATDVSEEWSTEDLRWLTHTVQAFDRLADDIRGLLIDYAEAVRRRQA